MNEFLNQLYEFLYINKCPHDVDLEEFTTEQGCSKKLNEDLQTCRNCWQSAIIKLKEDIKNE